MNRRLCKPWASSLAFLLAIPALLLAHGQSPSGKAPAAGRVRIVAQSTDERLEDIQESRDGTRLITHDRGFAPRLWDLRTKRLLKVLGGLSDNVHFVTFSPDGKRILCLAETEFAIWDAKFAKRLFAFNRSGEERFMSAAFSPDSKQIAIGTKTGPVLVMQADNPRDFRTFEGHRTPEPGKEPYVRFVEFSSDGTRLLSCTTMERQVRVWDVAAGKSIFTLSDHGHAPAWAHFSHDGKYLVATTLDHKAHLYEVASGKKLWVKDHAIGPKGLAGSTHMAAVFVGASPEGVLVAGGDGTMSILEPATQKLLRELKGHTKPIRELRRSLDGTKIATYGDDEQLKIWDAVAGKEYPPIERSFDETAGEFSTDGKSWWLGHMDGHITEHEVATGRSASTVLSSVQTMHGAYSTGQEGRVWTLLNSWQVFWKPSAPKEFFSQKHKLSPPELSPNGRYAVIFRPTGDYPDLLLRPNDNASVMAFKNQKGFRFSPNSDQFVSWQADGTATVWNSEDGKQVKGWKWDPSWAFTACAMAPHDKLVASVGQEGGGFLFHWEIETGRTGPTIRLRCGSPMDVSYSPDGGQIAVFGKKGLEIFDTKTGASVSFFPRDIASQVQARVLYAPDGKSIAAIGDDLILAWDVASGKEVVSARNGLFTVCPIGRISPDGLRILTFDENVLTVWSLRTGKAEAQAILSSRVESAAFAMNGTRILAADIAEGMTIFDAATTPELKKLGNFVAMKSGHWLAYDVEGRFDATDPDEAAGAHFVIEWEGGLETVELSQLKAQFYEPGLLAKMLGQDKEPARAVPDLEKLRLYPDVSLKAAPSNPMQLSVELLDRDEGGLGRTLVFINGKQILNRQGTGLFRLDVNDYRQYLLPETHLPKGQGNVVQVRAYNAAGTLLSPPATLDIGAPADLQVPKVRIHALCVGVGDYAGQGGDLLAPPADARAMGKALKEVADRLLPGQAQITVLATDAGDQEARPTRARIQAWFEELSKSATSSDVVFVFFAGHGVSRIGELSGYFFLTPEADPTEVNALSASTQTISGEDLKAMLGKTAANKQVVILDTCHSGAASKSLIEADRSVAGDYQRAWESIRDTTGVWMLAGSAADQLSYESANVEHGMLTYALLEAIDKASPEGLRPGSGGELFVDIERWLTYAATRVESLKTEVGLAGVQKPEFRRAKAGQSFDIGVTHSDKRGAIGLRPPKPIVIVGNFSMDEEDPAGIEGPLRTALRESSSLKPWFDIPKHPGVYRLAGTYSLEGDAVKVRVFLQQFDSGQNRKTLETFEVSGSKGDLKRLAAEIRAAAEQKIGRLEEAKSKPATSG
jgi:WD40 repeat protein/uncharacterized caspase-like protein